LLSPSLQKQIKELGILGSELS
jgi:hypothetical protein